MVKRFRNKLLKEAGWKKKRFSSNAGCMIWHNTTDPKWKGWELKVDTGGKSASLEGPRYIVIYFPGVPLFSGYIMNSYWRGQDMTPTGLFYYREDESSCTDKEYIKLQWLKKYLLSFLKEGA